MENFKRHFIKKWTKKYINELNEFKIVCNDEQLKIVEDLIGDLTICEKVFCNLFEFIDS